MVEVSNTETDVAGDVEVVGGVSVSAKKWTVEEDERLIRAWINVGMDAVVGNDQKRSDFEHGPRGASERTWKTLNGRWSRCAPLVSKWAGIISEVERINQSGWNEVMILEAAHKLYTECTRKKFDLEHWYEMLKDQPKWRAICDPPKSGSGSTKRSNPDTEEAGDEAVGGSERPEGRKAAKRRLKERVKNSVVDAITDQMSIINSRNAVATDAFTKLCDKAMEEKAQKMMMREQKLRVQEDRIMMLDTSMKPPDQAAYYEQRKTEIIQTRLG